MSSIEPLEYIVTMWITEPDSDLEITILASVIDAFYSIGALTITQYGVLSAVIQRGLKTGVLEDFKKVEKKLEALNDY